MQANYEMMQGFYDGLNTTVDAMLDSIKDAEDIVNKLDNWECWDGNGYDAYRKKFDDLVSNFGAFCNDLYKLNNNIKTSIENYKEVDKQSAEALHNGV